VLRVVVGHAGCDSVVTLVTEFQPPHSPNRHYAHRGVAGAGGVGGELEQSVGSVLPAILVNTRASSLRSWYDGRRAG
jgi:hypothetical protein